MLSRQLSTWPLPATPMPIGYCGRNRRFVLRICTCCSCNLYRTIMQTTSGRTSGKRAALRPLPPLRTGHDGFLSSGSSRRKSLVTKRSRHTPEYVLTICACSLLTAQSQWDRLMLAHGARKAEDAHATYVASICNFLLRRFCKFSRPLRPAGSLPAFAAELRDSYPLHYRVAFAFSSLLYPPPEQRTLR